MFNNYKLEWIKYKILEVKGPMTGPMELVLDVTNAAVVKTKLIHANFLFGG